ncbi:hypothetical protein F2P81_022698 [Scophthalmus maximus]|uniref:Uncharacterized protein n=1 Tax=Scophthalmus maximus TaxID=52904 RepID=A0A6A4RYV8_SCOMX|nr:hypothetical protein F2P81_022698 [Scophthalmus maximus]
MFKGRSSASASDPRRRPDVCSIHEICGAALPPGGRADKHTMKKQFNRMRQLANQTVGRSAPVFLDTGAILDPIEASRLTASLIGQFRQR